MSTARFGRENVVHGGDLVVLARGASGTAAEIVIAQALGIPMLPYAPSGGAAARTLEAMHAANPTGTGPIAEGTGLPTRMGHSGSIVTPRIGRCIRSSNNPHVCRSSWGASP